MTHSAPSDSDRRLIEAALRSVEGLNNVAAGKRLGVSEGTMRLWRAGERRPLHDATRASLRAALDPIPLAAAHAREWIVRLARQERALSRDEATLLHLLQQIIRLDPGDEAAQSERRTG